MQGDVNSRSRRSGVVRIKIQKRIKSRSWVCIQKRFPQSRVTDVAGRQILPFIPGITKTQLPIPSLEIIAKFSYFAAQANIEQIIVVSGLVMSRTGVVDGDKPNSGSYGEAASIGKKTWDSRIDDRERIKRILNWYTERARTKGRSRAWSLEWIGDDRHRCAGRIK